MITEILSNNTCAECGICCVFLESERWEMPHVTDGLKRLIAEKYELVPEYELYDGKQIFKHIPLVGSDFLRCPMLGESGCILGSDKPFECKLWPFRATRLCGGTAVTVSHFCKSVYDMPLSALTEFYERKLRSEIVCAVSENPYILTDYKEGYPIIGYIGKT